MESGTIMTKDAKSIIILFIAELLGAAFLTMSYVMNFGNIYSLGASFTILAIIFGKLSGGNFNLAVTFSQFIELIITGNFQAPLLLTLGILFVAQFAGGFLGKFNFFFININYYLNIINKELDLLMEC